MILTAVASQPVLGDVWALPDRWAWTPWPLIFCLVFHTLATEYHLGLLKAKLAKYRAQLLEPSKSASSKGEGFDVMKSGDARVALIGFPSVGKVSDAQRGPRGGKQEVIFQTGDHPGSPRCLSA